MRTLYIEITQQSTNKIKPAKTDKTSSRFTPWVDKTNVDTTGGCALEKTRWPQLQRSYRDSRPREF